MKSIFRQLIIVLGFLLIWYLFFLLLTFIFYPPKGVVDNSKLRVNLFDEETISDILGLWVNKQGVRNIYIMGASNVRGISPIILKSYLPEFNINSICVGGSNITQIRQIFDVTRMTNHGNIKGDIYVIGISPVLFEEDYTYKLNGLEVRANWSGLYKVKDKKLELVLNPHLMPVAVILSRPLYLWRIFFERSKEFYDNSWVYVQSLMGKHKEELKGEAFKLWAIDVWKRHYGDLNNFMEGNQGKQVEYLVSLSNQIVQSKASLVLVDIPSPKWLRERIGYYDKYMLKRRVFLNKILALPRVCYIDLNHSVPNSEFEDSTHPLPETAKKWSEAVGVFISSHRKNLEF